MDVAQTLADVAAAYLLNAQAREEAREASDRFHHNAQHDPLTGLPNRLMLQHRLEHAALRAQRSNTNAAILFADLDRFKQVNDTHGHPVGDELLLAVARRLSGLVRPGDTLARVSGDEFVFLCEDLHSAERRRGPRPAHRQGVRPPVRAQQRSSSRSPPVSASRSPVRVRPSPNQLVVQADTAMYQAKRKGGAGHQIIDLREAVQTHNRGQPRDGPARGHRQARARASPTNPSCAAPTDASPVSRPCVRWTHPHPRDGAGHLARRGRGAERADQRHRRLGARTQLPRPRPMAARAPRGAAGPRGERLGPPAVEAGLLRTVASVLDRTDMDPTALVLEMTENIFIEDTERAHDRA